MTASTYLRRLTAGASVLAVLTTAACASGATGTSGGQVRAGSAGPSRAPAPAIPGRLVWSDEFTGRAGMPPDARYWTTALGSGGNGWGSGQLQTYTASPANLALDGSGHLKLTARQGAVTGSDGITQQFSSARISTAGRVEPQYGTVEARLQLPSGAGLWPAFWLLGANFPEVGWPLSGEVDIMETHDEAHRVFSYLHYPFPGSPNGSVTGQRLLRGTAVSPGWHTYTLTWTADAMVIRIDGKVCLDAELRQLPAGAGAVFDKPFSILLNLAVGGTYPAPVDASTPFPSTLLVDYVRVYAPR